jgi:hypothetical protein
MNTLNKSARAFTASLKPAWTPEQMNKFVGSLTGSAYAYLITHDRDSNVETGEVVESHTHILVDYQTPRKLSTVANLFQVESNFVEVVKSKQAMLRYLIHLDDPDKFQYSPDDVIHNAGVDFADVIKGQSMTDKDIANYIRQGRGQELIGLVSGSKLRTIQAFLHFDRSGQIHSELRQLNQKVDSMVETLKSIDTIVHDFQEGIVSGAKELVGPLELIALEMRNVRHIFKPKSQAMDFVEDDEPK